jgi:hypothetical protein
MQVFPTVPSWLTELNDHFKVSQRYEIGFPINTAYNYSALAHFLDYRIINAGNPYDKSTFKTNTKELEKSVIDFFCNIWHTNATCNWVIFA